MFLRWVLPILVFAVVGPPSGMLLSLPLAGTGVPLLFVPIAAMVSYGVGLTAAFVAGIIFVALSEAFESFTSAKRTSAVLGVAFGSIAGCIGVLVQNRDMGVAVIPTTPGGQQLWLLGILAGSVCGFVCVHFREKAVARNQDQGG